MVISKATSKHLNHALLPILLMASSVLVSCLDQAGESGSSGSTDVSSTPPVYPTTPYVCSALSNSAPTSSDPSLGLIANLYYLDPTMPSYTDVNNYIGSGVAVSNISLFFNEVNIPTRSFSQGFSASDGTTLTNLQGNTLYEYFALEFQSDVVLGPNDPDGDYQFALLADDGAVLSMRDGQGNPAGTIVDANGTHPTLMGCGAQPVTLDHNSRLPIDLRYYQGPRYNIALVAMWRPWPTTDPVLDPQCGQLGNLHFFDWTQTPATPQQAYLDLLSRGWKVISPVNYKVPQGILNACNNVPAPTISNIAIQAVTATSATITWQTDVASMSQIQYTTIATGAVGATAVDSTLTTNHSVTVTNLTASTLYSATVISTSSSGNSTSGAAVGFRTTR